MKEVLQSRGAKNVWAMMDEFNGFLTGKGVGELEVVHDMYDYFSYNFVSRGTQIDYGRLPRADMIDYIKSIAKILNTSKALKGRRLFKKRK